MPLLPVPVPILTGFDAILEKRAVAAIQRADYKKWLRTGCSKNRLSNPFHRRRLKWPHRNQPC